MKYLIILNKILKFLIFLVITLSAILFACSCNGWGIMGHAIDEEYSPSVFQEVVDQDSVVHYYNATMYSGQMWCFKHAKYEEVRVISE